VIIFQWGRCFSECGAGGRKVLLTMFARQIFPSWAPMERFR
jgi:hypothetical protein